MRLLVVPFALALLGCAPDIGDACETSTDCSQNGDRLCDVSQRAHGGYCTVFDCEPGTCPDEAVCVLFGSSPSVVEQCANVSGNNPSQRTFCMKKCDNGSDCRGGDGYECREVGETAVNLDDGNGKVCMLPQSGEQPKTGDDPEARPGDVCTGVAMPSGSAGAGTGGVGGTGGSAAAEGGQGGEGGASAGD